MTARYWRDDAACLGAEVIEPWLPGIRSTDAPELARWYCMGCPVVRECATDALRNRDRGIIRAGLWLGDRPSPHVRRQLRTLAGADE